MTSVHDLSQRINTTPVTHYAVYRDVPGLATLVNGSGYLFRQEGERRAVLVAYRDPDLVLLGRRDLADAQRQAEDAAGGLAALVCGYATPPAATVPLA